MAASVKRWGTAGIVTPTMLEDITKSLPPTTRFDRPPESSHQILTSYYQIRPPSRINTASDDPLTRQFVSPYHYLAKPPIRSSLMVFDIVEQEHGSTQGKFGICISCHQILRARRSAPRIAADHRCFTPTRKSKGLHKEIWDRNKLPPNPAGAMCCSPLQTTSNTQHYRQEATRPDPV